MIESMTVRRVEYEPGRSRAEPPLDESWDELTKLRWKAALVAHDTGLTISVEDHAIGVERPGRIWQRLLGRWIWIPDTYAINVGQASTTAGDFHTAWTLLNGIQLGADQARNFYRRYPWAV